MLALRQAGLGRCRAAAPLLGGRRRGITARAVQVEEPVTATIAYATEEPSTATPATSAGPAGHANLPPNHDTTVGATGNISGDPNGGGAPKVAELDAQRFRLHPSVSFWHDFSTQINTMWSQSEVNFTAPVQQMVQRAADANVLRDPQSAQYWAYHTARMGFFIGQAAAGVLAHHLSETLPSSLTGLSSSSSSGDGSSKITTTPFQRLSANAGKELGNRTAEAIATFQQDYDNIKAGAYPMPWDMALTHRQNSPGYMLRKTAQFVEESVATLRRRVREQPEPLWLQAGGMYPQYYTKTFHFQTDGWFSEKSARIYEHSTEVLFFGRQDAMQRTSLLPISDFMAEAAQAGRQAGELRLLEVAAGTGRFHTFVKDAYPELRTVVSDLSPFYLARARDNVRYWKSARQPGRYLGGVDDTGTEFLQTAAEAIAAPDESFDILLCVYLFHELPEAVRRRAVAEFARVLRPGGLVVLTDSVQLGDRPAWDNTIGLFSNFNEPYYRSYVNCDLGAMFEEAGLVCDTKYLASASKTLSFRKPAA